MPACRVDVVGMAQYWRIVVWLFVVGTHLPSVDGLLPDVATLCPYNDFCNSNATMSRTQDEMHLTSCCQKCSCDPACHLVSNCCPDKMRSPDAVMYPYPCVSLSTYFNEPRGMVSNFLGNLLPYHIIDRCPDHLAGIAYPRCLELEVLEDYVVVTDPLTDMLYRNKHCAWCNGVTHENLTEWNLITDCDPYSDYQTIEAWHDYVMRNCSLIPYPPEPSVSQLVRCRRIFLDRCNITGNWDKYDIEVKNACELGYSDTNNIYRHEMQPTPYIRTLYYNNVYCFLCNTGQDDVHTSRLCEKADPDAPKSYGLSVFINFAKHPNANGGTIKTTQCDPSQIWNPFNGSCLSVRCPAATYSYNGKCEDLHKHLPRPSFTIMFRVNTSDDNYSVELEDFLKLAVTNRLANDECYHCVTSLKYDGVSNYFLTYELASQLSCDENFIVSKMKRFHKRSPIRLRFQNVTEVTIVPEFSPPEMRFIHSPKRNGLCTQIPFIVTWAMVDKCPRIHISSLGIDEVPDVIKTERNGTICVHEYFKIMTSLNNCDKVVSSRMMAGAAFVLLVTINMLI